MRKLSFILLLSLVGTLLCSQQIQFSRNYPFQLGSDYAGGVVQKADSGFVFISNVLQPLFVGYTFTETDKYGDTLYTKRYEFSTVAFSLGGSHSLIQTLGGGYVQCGSGIDTSNNRQGYIVKFDANGDTIWMKSYGGAGSDILNSIFQGADSNLWVCGTTNSISNGQDDFWLLLLDANGNIQLDTNYGTTADEDVMSGDFTYDGGFIMSGLRNAYPYLVKVDSLGNVDWAQDYFGYSGFGFITQLPDSHFILGCNKPVGPDEFGVLLNLDTSGSVVWYSSYLGFPLCTNAIYTKPVLCADGIAIAGVSLPNSPVATEAFLSKVDLSGNLLWQRMYTLNTNSSHHVYDFHSTSDHGFILGGSCYLSNQDAWLIKVDSLGCETAGCDGVGTLNADLINTVTVYPNPVASEITFSFGSNSQRRIDLFDSFGRLILTEQSASSQHAFEVESFAEGIYFYNIVEDGEIMSQGKFVVHH